MKVVRQETSWFLLLQVPSLLLVVRDDEPRVEASGLPLVLVLIPDLDSTVEAGPFGQGYISELLLHRGTRTILTGRTANIPSLR